MILRQTLTKEGNFPTITSSGSEMSLAEALNPEMDKSRKKVPLNRCVLPFNYLKFIKYFLNV